MKRTLLLLSVLLLMLGCARQAAFKSKGISYFEKPQQEIESVYTFPLIQEGYFPTSFIMNQVEFEDVIFAPQYISFKTGDKSYHYTAVYAFDKQNLTLKDSLVIRVTIYRHLIIN